MPQRTIAPGGGNWNSTATWVEGAIPTTSDFVVGLATSGQLTMNVGATVQYVDFTNYANTLTLTNFLQTSLASATNTFGTSMSFAGTNTFNFYNNPGTLVQNTTNRIPHLQTANGTKTLSTDVYCTNYTAQNGQTYNGNNLYVYGNYSDGSGTLGGTTKFQIVGTGTLNVAGLNNEMIINTTGTTTISSAGIVLGSNINNGNQCIFRHQQGTIVNPKFRSLLNYGSGNSHLIDLISGTTWDIVLYSQLSTVALPSLVNFTGSCNFDNFILSSINTSAAAATGNGIRISGSNLNINNFQIINNMSNPGGNYGIADFVFYTDNTQTINVSNTFISNGGLNYGSGTANPNTEIRSFTSGTTTNLNVSSYNQYVSSTRFTDISCSGGNTLYGQNLSLTRTTNITQYTLPPSGGGGESSYVFIS